MLRPPCIPAFLVMVLALACGDARGKDVEKQLFVIAGVGPMELPMSADGAPPARDRKVKIEFAGFMVGKSQANSRESELIWTFAFRGKSLKDVESVQVHEVSPSPVEIPLVLDSQPVFRGRDWIGSAKPQPASAETQKWLYAQGTTIFVFRFTIKEKGKEPRVLYQPTSFSPAAKAQFQAMIERIRNPPAQP